MIYKGYNGPTTKGITVIALIIDAVVSVAAGSVITALAYTRKQKSTFQRYVSEYMEDASERYQTGWDKGSEYILRLPEADIKALQRNLRE